MQKLSVLLETGEWEDFTPEKDMTIGDLLQDLNLDGKYFGILVNGKRADEYTIISPKDKIVILPHIAGGAKDYNKDEAGIDADGIKYGPQKP
jgi:sulfur carrier protein ThiS